MINRPPPRKLLIVLSFWDGDHEQMGTLCHLLSDLEPVKNQYADILLYRRSDSAEMDPDIRSKLLSKFSKVHSMKCRRLNAVGYPLGCNEMFYDLIEQIRAPAWSTNYFAFYNMESDCVPLAVNWIQQLSDEYKKTNEENSAIGHFCEKPVLHMNGASIYSTDFFNRAGGLDLLGGPSQIAYDFYHAKRVLSVARDTSLMALDFNRKTITAEDLFGLRKNGVKPAVFHGVKDQSALIAVRSHLIDRNPAIKDLSSRTIFTYFEPNPAFDEAQERSCLALWKDAWTCAGWNTIIHERRDAQKNPRYQAVHDKVSSMAGFKHKGHDMSCYMRWLALEYAGGGLHCDYDVLPRSTYHPEDIDRLKGVRVYQGSGRKPTFSLFSADRESCAAVLREVSAYPDKSKFIPDNENVTSFGVEPLVKNIGEKGWEKAKCVHFSPSACDNFQHGSVRSLLMENYLAGKIEIKI